MPCGYQSVVSLSPEFQQNAAAWWVAPGLQETPARFALSSTAVTVAVGSIPSSWLITGL